MNRGGKEKKKKKKFFFFFFFFRFKATRFEINLKSNIRTTSPPPLPILRLLLLII